MEDEDVIVNRADDLFHKSSDFDHRKVGEYKSTNTPLSKAEIARDEAIDTADRGWAPRTTENIGDMVPLPEKPGPPSDID